ncbi:cytochrome c oxidase assembly protein [Nocardioides korecus]
MRSTPYTFATAVGRWSLDVPVLAGLVVALLVYLAGVLAVRRRGGTWSRTRTVLFAVVGLGGVALCTMSSLAAYDHTYLWALLAQLTLLLSLAPVGIALGDPVGLARAALPGRGRARLERVLASLPVRVLTFPVVSAVLAVTVTLVVLFTGVLGDALRDGTVLDLVYLLMLVVGCLAALPVLGAEILPAWCTEPLTLLFSAADGLLDAIPGIAVMSTTTHLAGGYFDRSGGTGLLAGSTDPNGAVHAAGTLMLALTEVVTLPIVVILFFRWASQETGRDRPRHLVAAPVPGPAAPEPALQRPWWETEGMGRRNPGWPGRDDG